MKIELIHYMNDEHQHRWKITKDGAFINCYLTVEDAIEGFEKLVSRLQEPKINETVIKSVEI